MWPDLDVHLTSVTDQWAGAAVAGPRSRDLLAAACDGADVSDEALPFMGCMEATVAGAPVRIIRMTFSGEMAYEVHCPADHGVHVWEALLAAGEPFDVMPYGTEALGVLRIEKGHVVPNELDGRTIPADFGFDRMEKDEDFIGRRSLERFRTSGRKRKTFVGPRLGERQGDPARRAPGVEPDRAEADAMLGHVTSNCYSPTLESLHRAGADGRRRGLEGQGCSTRRRRSRRASFRSGDRPRVHRPREPATAGMSGHGGF